MSANWRYRTSSVWHCRPFGLDRGASVALGLSKIFHPLVLVLGRTQSDFAIEWHLSRWRE
jgi:hypothetical protein